MARAAGRSLLRTGGKLGRMETNTGGQEKQGNPGGQLR